MRKLHHVFMYLLLCSLAAPFAFSQAPVWSSLSAGLVYSVLCDGANRVLVGTQVGVTISTDGGKSWPVRGVYKPVHALAVDRQGRIFAGSERGNIYVSTDGGVTWSVGSVGSRVTVNTLCVDQAGIVYASTDGYGLNASTDHGASWHGAGFSGLTVFKVAMNSHNTLFAVVYSEGLYQSTDGGVTWTLTGLASTPVRTLAVGPRDQLYAGVQNGGLSFSTDNGATWAAHGLSGMNTTCLVVSPEGVPYAATQYEVFRGSDSDTSWTSEGVPWTTSTSALAFADDSSMYAVTAGEMYERPGGSSWLQCGFDTRGRTTNALFSLGDRLIAASADPGLLFQNTGGFIWQLQDTLLMGGEVRSFAGMQEGPLYAGTADGKILISVDSATRWHQTAFATNSSMVFALALDLKGRLFAGTLGEGVYESSDSGAQWNSLNSGLGNPYVRALLSCPGEILLAGTDGGLYRSTDNGAHWLSLPVLDGVVWCLVQDRYGFLYAGTGEKGIFRSKDAGISWEPLNNGLTCLSVRCLALDGSGRYFAGTFGGGVFQSSDRGVAWVPINNGLSDPDVVSLAVSSDGTLYAGTRQNWISRIAMGPLAGVTEHPSDLPYVTRLEPNYPNPFNPVTTIKYTVGGVRPLDSFAKDAQSLGVQPSRAEGLVARDVSLIVHDVLGRQVATLVNEVKAAGTYEVRFDASRLASGVYFYRLTAGSFVLSRKMLLLK